MLEVPISLCLEKKKKDPDCEINDICLAFLLHFKEKYALKSGISEVCSCTPAFSSVCPPQLCLSQSFFFGFSLLGYEQSHDIKSKITSAWLYISTFAVTPGRSSGAVINRNGSRAPHGLVPSARTELLLTGFMQKVGFGFW